MVRRLLEGDSDNYFALRQEALQREPHSFGSSPGDDRFRSVELVRETLRDPNQAVLGAFAPALVGAVGIRRLEREKLRHRAELWGMYVRAGHRRAGHGRQLVEHAIGVARGLDGVGQLQLTVTETAVAARALYETMGFVVWGVEPAGLCVNGVELAQAHMVLRL